MDNLMVKTDGEVRPLVNFCELPAEVQKDFDYIEADDYFSDRFVFFNDAWYDVNDSQVIRPRSMHDRPMGWAMYVTEDHPFAAWHAIVSETFFSGVLFKLVFDSPEFEDGVICGTYCS